MCKGSLGEDSSDGYEVPEFIHDMSLSLCWVLPWGREKRQPMGAGTGPQAKELGCPGEAMLAS